MEAIGQLCQILATCPVEGQVTAHSPQSFHRNFGPSMFASKQQTPSFATHHRRRLKSFKFWRRRRARDVWLQRSPSRSLPWHPMRRGPQSQSSVSVWVWPKMGGVDDVLVLPDPTDPRGWATQSGSSFTWNVVLKIKRFPYQVAVTCEEVQEGLSLLLSLTFCSALLHAEAAPARLMPLLVKRVTHVRRTRSMIETKW